MKNEKAILLTLRKDEDSKEPIPFVVKLQETFLDYENINFVFEYLPGQLQVGRGWFGMVAFETEEICG